MTTVVNTTTRPPATGRRVAQPRRYLMCPPDHFTVDYSINPWMDPGVPVDRALARRQWDALYRVYVDLGHDVHVVPAVPGLPDMVFAANGGLVVDGHALGARFAYPQRAAEGPAYLAQLRRLGLTSVVEARHTNEGEGDFLVLGDLILAGTGFRTSPEAHAEVQERFGRPVVSLGLVDPRYYHLDTALAVLDDHSVAYYPGAFSRGGRRVLRRLFPDAILADASDAAVFGLNAVSDGLHVVLAAQATGLAAKLRDRGYEPIGVDLSELGKSGGGVKCCTLELRS